MLLIIMMFGMKMLSVIDNTTQLLVDLFIGLSTLEAGNQILCICCGVCMLCSAVANHAYIPSWLLCGHLLCWVAGWPIWQCYIY